MASRIADPSCRRKISSLGLCASFFFLGMWILATALSGRLSIDPFVRSRTSTQYRKTCSSSGRSASLFPVVFRTKHPQLKWACMVIASAWERTGHASEASRSSISRSCSHWSIARAIASPLRTEHHQFGNGADPYTLISIPPLSESILFSGDDGRFPAFQLT
jgi:hypothetical protein